MLLAVSALVVGAVVTVAPAPPAGAQSKSAKTARDLPGLVSAPRPQAAPEAASGNFSSPPRLGPDDPMPTPVAKPASYDPARSRVIDAETNPTAKVSANPDGSRTLDLATRPVRYRDPAGAWRDIDLALAAGPDGVLAPKATPRPLRLAPTALGAVATVDTPAGPLALRHPDAAAVRAVTGRDRAGAATATYPRALPGGRDLVLAATAEGLEEAVVLPDATAPASYTTELVLPPGLTARQGRTGIDLLDAAGAVVATYGDGFAHDASFPANPAAITPVSVRLVGMAAQVATPTTVAARVATVEVAAPADWLAQPGRAYPVTIDPTITITPTTAAAGGGRDTFVQSGANANAAFGAATYLYAGTANAGANINRTLLYFDLGSAPVADVIVNSANVTIWNSYSTSCAARDVSVQGLGQSWTSAAATWNNAPSLDAGSPRTTGGSASFGATGCPGAYTNLDVAPQAQRWMDTTATNNGLMVSASESDSAAIRGYNPSEAAGYAVILSITYYHNQIPGFATRLSPADAAVVATATPLLSVNPATDPDGQTVHYWYTLSTSPDASLGQRVVWSGWLGGGFPYDAPVGGAPDGTTYPVPAGALVDGVTYYWGASTWDGVAANSSRAFSLPPWSFRVELGQGVHPARPADAIGPARVDLASGNVSVGQASPAMAGVGGPVGVGYTYNSAGAAAASTAPAPGRTTGLRGVYYNDPTQSHDFTAKTPVLSRRDSNLAFVWSGDHASPAPGVVAADDFLVRWSGTLSVPTSGTWKLWTANDGGVRITVGTTVILDDWTDHYVWPNYSSGISLTANQPVPIVIDYFEHNGGALLALGAQSPPGPTSKDLIVPTSWLSTDAGPLPAGWSLGAGALALDALRLGEDNAVASDPSGAARVWAARGAGGFAPPPDTDAILGLDATGAATLHAGDGTAYVFDSAGQLAGATSALDDVTRASPDYGWSTVANRPRLLVSMTETATGRVVTLRYQGLDPAKPCPAPAANFAAAPANQLCQVDYWDTTATTLSYNAGGQLARIEDPGGGVSDFAYNSAGLLGSVRDPLAADAVAATTLTGRSDDATVRTEIAYAAAPGPPRATSLTLPAPLAGAARPAHTYTYTSATETHVEVAGLAPPQGFARRAVFTRDPTSKVTTVVDTDADGVVSTTVFDPGDRPVSFDAAGRRSTVTYDADAVRAQPSGRATDTTGPWPSAVGTPPHTATTFDANPASGAALTGLATTYWANRSLAGAPAAHGRVTPTSGALTPLNELTGAPTTVDPPAPGLVSRSWSARYSGEVDLATAAPYGFAVELTGAARLFIDDALVVDAWATHATSATVAGTFANALAGRHRIRVDYAADATATPSLALRWTPPPPGVDVAVPAASLAPRYSNPTISVSDDTTAGVTSRRADTTYQGMANRLVNASTADRAGLNIATTMTYESGAGFLRPKTRALGAGAGTLTTYDYYPALAAPVATTCPGAAPDQAMALKSTTGATPAAGTGAALVRQFTYDRAGRVVGSATAGNWTCTAYDARGRVATVAIPAYGTEPAHTLASDYKVGGNPLVSSTSDTVAAPPPPPTTTTTMTTPAATTTTMKTTIDLLGRVVSYDDVWGKTTTSTYDQPGRRTATSGPAGVVAVTYTPAGRISTQSLDGPLMATATNDATTGELTSVSYASAINGGNGTALSNITRHGTGLTTGLTWTVISSAATIATDAVVRSQSGRVVDETIDGTDADPANANLTYDTLGRLTSARIAGHTLDYGFAVTGGCGPQSAPGKNSNRSSLTDTPTGGTATTTTSCYDNADRLTSSTDAAVGTPAYDSHGNTVTLGTQTLVYDGADRHMKTTVSGGGPVVTYLRDASGRITSRTEGTAVTHYGFSGPGDSPGFVMDAANNVTERTIALVGGVMVTKRGGLLGAGDVWSYPNIHGDVMAVADNNGAKQGATKTYDPNGVALTGLADNSAGNFDYGWLGSAQRPIEHAGTLATIEMGARQYVPSIGRFLQVDPVEGGSANDYDYGAGDPVNNYDLDGTRCLTGVARRVEEQRYNSKTGETETKTREICRSVSRGAGRAARAIADDPGKYFTQCLRGVATGAVTGVYVGGLAGAAGNGARECLSNVVAQALIDGGVDKEFVTWANGVSSAYSGAKNFAVGTTQIVEFRGPFYP